MNKIHQIALYCVNMDLIHSQMRLRKACITTSNPRHLADFKAPDPCKFFRTNMCDAGLHNNFPLIHISHLKDPLPYKNQNPTLHSIMHCLH